MTTKQRVYEVARDLGMDNRALVALLQSVGVTEAKNHMSAIAPEQVERLKRHLEKQKNPAVVEERIRPTVVKRRSVSKPEGPTSVPPSRVSVSPEGPVSEAPRSVVSRPPVSMPVPSTPPVSVVASAPPPSLSSVLRPSSRRHRRRLPSRPSPNRRRLARVPFQHP